MAQEAGPGSGQMRTGPHGSPGQYSALRAYQLAAPLAAAHLQDLGRDPRAPYAPVPRSAAGPGPGPRPRCLGSRQYPGSASWTSRETETKC